MRHEDKVEPKTGRRGQGMFGPLDIRPHWRNETVETALIGLFVLAVAFTLEWAAYVFIPVTTALIVGLTLGPVVDGMDRIGLPRHLSGFLILTGMGAFGYLLFLAFAIPLEEWSVRVPEIIDRLREAVFWIKDPLDRLHELSREVSEAANGQEGELSVSLKQQGVVTTALASAPALFGQLLIFTGVFYFFVVTRTPLKRAMVALPSRRAAQLRLARAIRDTEYSFSRYLLAITFINIMFGVITGLAMWALGMPSPALWGALAAVLNFIMFIGPALMALILAGVALVSYDTFTAALVPPLVFIGLNLLEGQFVTPAIVGARLVLNPLLVFLSLTFWLWLWGPIGAFLAVPILILATVALYHTLPPARRQALGFTPP